MIENFMSITKVGLCAAVLAVSGCATATRTFDSITQSEPDSTRLEVIAALDHETEYASTNVILEGVVIGAALGCGIGLLFGGSAEDCLVGAAVGGVGGGVAGAVVAEENKKQIIAEDKEDELYAQLVSEGEDLRAYNNKVEQAVARLDADLRSLESRRRSKQVTAEIYDAEKASIKRDSSRLATHTQKQRETVEERNEVLVDYELSRRTTKARDVNLAVVFESADLAKDFDQKLEI